MTEKSQNEKVDKLPRRNARESILDAAEETILTSGAQALTLDEVAKRAGVSKGGLFYHFSSKEELLVGIVSRLVGRWESEEENYAEIVGGGMDTRIRLSIAQIARDDASQDHLAAAVFAAVANDVGLLAPLRPVVRERYQNFKDCKIGFPHAAILDLAVTGLTLLEMLRLNPLNSVDRKLLIEAMDQMAGGDGNLLPPEPTTSS